MRYLRFAGGLVVVLLTLASAGCTKLSPASVDDFGAEKKLQVTLRDGETISGHLDEGEWVTFKTLGRVYKAQVESIDDNANIVLANAFVQEEYERFELQRARMEGANLKLRDGTETISIPAYKIVKVEQVTMDRMKSARAAGFWIFTIFVASQIMNARL